MMERGTGAWLPCLPSCSQPCPKPSPTKTTAALPGVGTEVPLWGSLCLLSAFSPGGDLGVNTGRSGLGTESSTVSGQGLMVVVSSSVRQGHIVAGEWLGRGPCFSPHIWISASWEGELQTQLQCVGLLTLGRCEVMRLCCFK